MAAIKEIGPFRVRIEKMKPSEIVQCRRCQRYQHTAAGCGFAYRCVQCVTVHLPGACPRAANKSLPLGCINCYCARLKHDTHTANDHRNCEFYRTKTGSKSGTTAATSTSTGTESPATSTLNGHKSAGNANAATSTAHTAPRLGITEPIKANNPGETKRGKGKKKNRTGHKASAGTSNASGTNAENWQIATGGPDTGMAKRLRSDGDACGRLITALLSVLTAFQ